jgi:hypothetical protein
MGMIILLTVGQKLRVSVRRFHMLGTAVLMALLSYCNFKPAFVMIKRTDSAGLVYIDSSRSSTNPAQLNLLANDSAIETDGSRVVDFFLMDLKLEQLDGDLNASGGTYIGMHLQSLPSKLLMPSK